MRVIMVVAAIENDKENILKWAEARTHLLNKITLELKAIHRLTEG